MIIAMQNKDNYGPRTKVHQYKRLTRFREVLRQVQGLGGGHIPPNVIAVVKEETGKYSKHRCSFDPAFVRAALRRRDMGKWAEHSVRLASMLGFRPPLIDQELNTVAERMFKVCDGVWLTVKRKVYEDLRWDRHNFPSYINVIYNFFLLLNKQDLANYIRPLLLKSRPLYQIQQVYWRYFCYLLDWPFHRIQGSTIPRHNYLKAPRPHRLPHRWHPRDPPKSTSRSLRQEVASGTAGSKNMKILDMLRRLNTSGTYSKARPVESLYGERIGFLTLRSGMRTAMTSLRL